MLPLAESCLVSDELLQYRHFTSKQLFDKDLSDDQEEEVLAQFAALDPEKKGHIEWSDFLYFESLAVLKKLRTEVTRCFLTQGATEHEYSCVIALSSIDVLYIVPKRLCLT